MSTKFPTLFPEDDGERIATAARAAAARASHKQLIAQLVKFFTRSSEARLWLRHYSKVDSERFAVIKVSGDILHNPEEAARVASSLAFLHRMGLFPVVVHGAGMFTGHRGEMMRSVMAPLAEAAQAGRPPEPSDVANAMGAARQYMLDANSALVSSLRALSVDTVALPDTAFSVELDESYEGPLRGIRGRISAVNLELITDAIAAGSIPVCGCMGTLSSADEDDAAAAASMVVDARRAGDEENRWGRSFSRSFGEHVHGSQDPPPPSSADPRSWAREQMDEAEMEELREEIAEEVEDEDAGPDPLLTDLLLAMEDRVSVVAAAASSVEPSEADISLPPAAVDEVLDQVRHLTFPSAAATAALAAELRPLKVVYLRTRGPLRQQGERIPRISLASDFESLVPRRTYDRTWMTDRLLHEAGVPSLLPSLPSPEDVFSDPLSLGPRLDDADAQILAEIWTLYASGALELGATAAVTQPDSLAEELFSNRGGGSLVVPGERIRVLRSFDGLNLDHMRSVLEASFGGTLPSDFFETTSRRLRSLIVSDSGRGLAIVTNEQLSGDEGGRSLAYLDKFAVDPSAQGEQLGEAIWKVLCTEEPSFFWRSRTTNVVNGWYFSQADGSYKALIPGTVSPATAMHRADAAPTTGAWTVFWRGLADADIVPAIRSALLLPATFKKEPKVGPDGPILAGGVAPDSAASLLGQTK